MLFSSKSKIQAAQLRITTGMLGEISFDVPCVRIAGAVPPGSEGNAAIAACFSQISQAVDIQSPARRLLVYDMTDLRYEFGDHLGAFLWNLPALLDGAAIMIAARGETRGNLESLKRFIGSWLPVGFYDSLHAIMTDLRDGAETVQVLEHKRDACAPRGQVCIPSGTGVSVVLLGSRQVGRQYRTGRACRADSDLDCGVVGGPEELALLTVTMGDQHCLLPQMEHPPIKTYSSVVEAEAQGLCVIMARPR